MSEAHKSLLSGRVLARSAVWNFAGLAAPMLVGLFSIPLLIDGLGKERFGLLTLIWMGVGYFSLFDMGLGRALTKLVAERLGGDKLDDLGVLIWTALFLIFSLGVMGALIIFTGARPLVEHVLNVESLLQVEAVDAFRVLALGLPVVVVSSAIIGILEAHQRFAVITSVRIPLGILTFAAPLATLQYTTSLVLATAALLIARLLAMITYFGAATFVRKELKRPCPPSKFHMKSLFQFGGWLTVTNIIGPLMVYFDRFFIGAILNMTAVTYYVTPYEVLSRLQVLPQSIMGVLFPAMAAAISGDRQRLPDLYRQSSKVLLLLMLPVSSSLFLLAPEALQLWLGSDFRSAAAPVVYWLALGWLINTMARPALTSLQTSGRPDLVAKTHLLELGPYLITLWICTQAYGIAGTAAAWFFRVLIDTLILNFLARQQLHDLTNIIRRNYFMMAAILAGFFLAWLIESLILRIALLMVVCICSGALLWPIVRKLRKPNPVKTE